MPDIVYRGLLSAGRWTSWSSFAQSYWAEVGHEGEDAPATDLLFDCSEALDLRWFYAMDAVVEVAADDDGLCFLGAGPLEDLLSHDRRDNRHAEVVPEVVSRVQGDERWRKALSCVWLGEGVPSEFRQRLSALGAKDLTAPPTRETPSTTISRALPDER